MTVAAAPRTPVADSSLTRKTLWSAVASLLHLLGGLGCTILVARILGNEGTGQVAYLLWLSEIGVHLCTFGLGPGLTRYLADLNGRGDRAAIPGLTRWLLLRYLLLSAGGAALLGAVGPSIARGEFGVAAWVAVALFLLVRSLEALYRAELTGVQRFDALAHVNGVGAFARILGVALGAFTGGVAGALLGYALGSGFPALLSLRSLKGPAAPPAPELRRGLRTYALYAWAAAFFSAVLWNRMEVLFLERTWNAGEVATFTLGLSLASVATGGPIMLVGALVPHFAERAGASDSAAIRATYASATRMLAFLLFPLCLGTAAILPALLPLLFGAKFAGAVPAAMVLVAGSVLAYASVGSSLIYGVGQVRFVALSGSVGMAVALLAFLIVIPAHGAWGAAWARSGVQLALVLWAHLYIARRLGCLPPLRALLRTLLAALLCAAAAFVPVALWREAASLAVAVPVGMGVYVLAARLLRALEPEDATRLATIASRLPAPFARPLGAVVRWSRGAA